MIFAPANYDKFQTEFFYVTEQTGNSEIYFTDDIEIYICRLTEHPADETAPAWSPAK